MRNYAKSEPVDFVIVGTGAGGGTLAALLAEQGFSVVAFDAGGYFPPAGGFRIRRNRAEPALLDRQARPRRRQPDQDGRQQFSGKAVGGIDRPLCDGVAALPARVVQGSRPSSAMGRTGRSRGRRCGSYYGIAERQINISGPLTYPWGPKRPRYPYRAHELNTAGKLLGERLRGDRYRLDARRRWRRFRRLMRGPRERVAPCVYRGFCRFGCSTNAKRSALTVWIPRALAAGAEVRDLAMVGRIETGSDGRVTGVHYHRDGGWRFQRAKNVVVAGYAVETPRLLLNSATERYPDGLANSSGLVGKNLMTQSNQPVWGRMEEPVRWYKGPPSPGHHRALELRRQQGLLRRLLLDGTGTAAHRMGVGADWRARPLGRGSAPRDAGL